MDGEEQVGEAHGQNVQQGVVDVGIELLCGRDWQLCEVRRVREGGEGTERRDEALTKWYTWVEAAPEK